MRLPSLSRIERNIRLKQSTTLSQQFATVFQMVGIKIIAIILVIALFAIAFWYQGRINEKETEGNNSSYSEDVNEETKTFFDFFISSANEKE